MKSAAKRQAAGGGSGGGGTRRLVAAVLPVLSMPTSNRIFDPGARSDAEPSVNREMWKNTSFPPFSGRIKPNPLSSKYLTMEPVCSPEVHDPPPSPVAVGCPEEGRVLLSPTPCFSRAMSSSVNSLLLAVRSVGILRLG